MCDKGQIAVADVDICMRSTCVANDDLSHYASRRRDDSIEIELRSREWARHAPIARIDVTSVQEYKRTTCTLGGERVLC